MSPWSHPCGSGPGMYGRTSAGLTVNSKRRLQRSARRGNSTLPGTRYRTQGRYQTPRLWRWLRPPFELVGGIPARSWQHRSASGTSVLWVQGIVFYGLSNGEKEDHKRERTISAEKGKKEDHKRGKTGFLQGSFRIRDTLNPLKRVSFLSNGTVHGHAPGSPHKHPAVLDSVLRQDNAGRKNPAGGPCPGYYYAGDFPDVDT